MTTSWISSTALRACSKTASTSFRPTPDWRALGRTYIPHSNPLWPCFGPDCTRKPATPSRSGRAMHPHLMRAAGAWPQFEPGTAVMGAEDAVFGHGGLPLRVDDHAPSGAAGLLAQPRLDAAFRRIGDAGDDRPVDLLDLALGEQPPEPAQCLRMAAEYQAARGVAVEAVGEGGRMRQAEAQERKPVLKMRPAARPG